MAEECDKCGKSFESEEALEQHLEDYDHSDEDEEKPGMVEKLVDSNTVGLAVMALILIGIGFLGVSSLQDSDDSSTGAEATESINYDGEPYIGAENASVTIAYFGDYNCSSCRLFEQRVFPELRNELLEEEDVRFVKKNFAVINHQSPQLARASQSVWDQVKESDPELFWDWHQHIYQNQGAYGSNWATNEQIIGLTRDVEGVDAEQVREDLNSGTYNSEIRKDQREGESLGVRGTPTFIIYGEETGDSRQLVGPQPVSEFSRAIQYVKS